MHEYKHELSYYEYLNAKRIREHLIDALGELTSKEKLYIKIESGKFRRLHYANALLEYRKGIPHIYLVGIVIRDIRKCL